MKIHFIGIGGIGVSALAQYYLAKKNQITGSDLTCSEIISFLRKKKIKIIIGQHKAKNLPEKLDLIIYSPAVEKNNPELQAARKRKIKCLTYPQALGQITKQYFAIAVSGTHGKSTTSAMLGFLMVKAKMDPTVIIGTKLKQFNNSNFRTGQSKYLVIEADEHFASFLNYWPKMIVLTNIEADHLDYYKTFNNLKKTFKKYLSRLPKDGVLIKKKKINKKDFDRLKKVLKVPGDHNIENAFLALSAARFLKIPDKISFKTLGCYQGSWRRFEEKNIIINNKKIKLISDYGHHPTEIKVTLKAAREKYPDKKIWSVYQPHQYQRTYHLFNNFVQQFKKAETDKIIITDIYDVAGREEKKIKNKVNSKKLVEKINKKNVIYLENKKILNFLKKNKNDFQVLIIMGAGDIYNIIAKFSTNNNHSRLTRKLK
jgi:UDP-N-acetylmuramate--alanine ligase